MNTYQIEIPTAACHGCTAVEKLDGTKLVAWFGGTAEGDDDVGIWGVECNDRGALSRPRLLAKVRLIPHWNPVLTRMGPALTLFFKVGKSIPSWRTYVMRSYDEGMSWTVPVELIPGDRGGRGPVKNKCIQLEDGTWLAPASREGRRWRPFVDLSHDDGISWERSGYVPLPRRVVGDCQGRPLYLGAIQPALWEGPACHVHMLLRSNGGQILRSDSLDGGRTWCQANETGLPSNNSGLDLAKLPDGTLLLVCNPVSGDWKVRTPLSLLCSRDHGQSWKESAILADREGMEYSYPSVIPTSSGGIFVVHTYERKAVGVAVLSADECRRL